MHDCVYEVYLAVFARVTSVVTADDDVELRRVASTFGALTGGARLAASLAKSDAIWERPVRDKASVCRATCDAPCEDHPEESVRLKYPRRKPG